MIRILQCYLTAKLKSYKLLDFILPQQDNCHFNTLQWFGLKFVELVALHFLDKERISGRYK